MFNFSADLQHGGAAFYPGTYVRPHRHPHTFELLLPLRGRFVVLNFDDRGTVTHRAILGETCTVLEMAAGTWHAVLSLDTGGIIFEVKHGGYQPVAADDYAHWAPAEGEPGTTELMAWYAQAQVGDSTFAV
ncbi:tryptophan synthase subunit beta like protein [Enterobacter hormaechei]|uniref:Tryptophan synthase subunit beta like protein n=1 Tax=Enterobacter hormaechei TaxID=158836 RepID=A0AAP8KNT3_9ENTR|nr:tryptophan synthase subunit beta like protein [Enterobacter hormaechei]